jgi:hypothetical protein
MTQPICVTCIQKVLLMFYLILLKQVLMDLHLTGDSVNPQSGLRLSTKFLKLGLDRFLWHLAHVHTNSCELTYKRVRTRFGGAPRTTRNRRGTRSNVGAELRPVRLT